MKIKIITGYWMNATGFPFWSSNEVRKDRYLGSIKAHCENIELPIICYTHKESIHELMELKLNHNLSNLEIKIMELSDMKYHNRFMGIRNNGNQEELDGRGCEILWGKIQVIENELNDCDRIFWIDAGLQHPGIFPWRFSKKYFKKEHHLNLKNWWVEHDVYNFKELLNTQTFNNLNLITKNKFMILGASSPQTIIDYNELGLIDYSVSPPYPIGGLFGGDIVKVKKFINLFWVNAEKVLDVNQLKTEEYIMKLTYDEMIDDEKTYIPFDVHATHEHDPFHFEEWDSESNPKPLYITLIELLNYKNK